MTQTPSGWYPDTQIPGQQRYWDGEKWTDHTAPLAAPPVTQQVVQSPPKRHRVRNVILGVLGVLIVISVAASLLGGGKSDDTTLTSDDLSTTDSPSPTATVKPSPSKKAEPAPDYTAAQDNAIRAAKQYLTLGAGFSRQGLIDQLSSPAGNDFARADAVFAVNHIQVNYKNQAVLAAKNYLKLTGFSRSGLIQQLTSSAGSKFTQEQAEFAADRVGLK